MVGTKETFEDFQNKSLDGFVIFKMANTIELEGELKLRTSAPGMFPPPVMYVGMFAGESKPKPFQRKRPNLSKLPVGKLPGLMDMRSQALELHRGSYRPCPSGVSRRLDLAVQHIHEGFNTFNLVRVRGVPSIANQYRPESVVQIKEEAWVFKPFGANSTNTIDLKFDDITEWRVEENGINDSGIELQLANGGVLVFVFTHVRDVKHTMEYYWNTFKVATGGAVKMGSTHGRPIVTTTTLSGEVPATPSPVGQYDVVDQDGIVVRPGGKMVPRTRNSMMGGGKDIKIVPLENRSVKPHWPKVVMHQGWLLKKGGVGVGASKSWIKRYFVLYKTSQGHFLVYYADFTECPLFSTERGYRNVVDLAKCTFIRPGSIKAASADTPPNSFDIVTTEREWTLCAETQENAQRWLQLLTRAVDEDVAILPDEELIFKVKPKVDPVGLLPSSDYTTSLKVSAHGISVTIPDANAKSNSMSGPPEREVFFWVYTDFYKWSLLSQNSKLAILINVFADDTFSRRNEFIFRNKEAVRLATSIEYFIEKFMCVMHIRLETTEGEIAEEDSASPEYAQEVSQGLHHAPLYEDRRADEIDLLDMGDGSPRVVTNTTDPFGNSSPFEDDDDVGYNDVNNAPTNSRASILDDDILGLGASTRSLNINSGPAPAVSAVPVAVQSANVDFFGGDVFAAPVAVAPTPAAVRIAPPLSSSQNEQHAVWFKSLIMRFSGPLYDDGALQVAATVEVRGSQGRVSFFFRNQGPSTISNLELNVDDSVGLTRFQLGPGLSTIPPLTNPSVQQQLMLECMKPISGTPSVTISYVDSLVGQRSNVLPLPVMITSFNDPLVLVGADFIARWDSLTAPGLQAQEVFHPSRRIVPAEISAGLSNVSLSAILFSLY